MKTEKRLIEARYLTSQMYLICEACHTENVFIDVIIDEIDNAPTVDAVEVVRCKDCKKRDANLCPLYHCVSQMITSMDDDFCSHGERKSDG